MTVRILQGDCREVLKTLADESVHCVVTSPPYWGLRDYGTAGQLGLEPSPEQYVANMVEVFREVRRVLRSDGTLWLNLGDCYANDWKWGGATGGKHVKALHGTQVGRAKRDTGLKAKDLVGIPWRIAFALQADGWWLRQDIIWHKPNPMPESVRDRCTKAHEYVFHFAKSERYYFDADAIAEPVTDGSVARVMQDGFDEQTGGPKDYARAGVPGHSVRKITENFAARVKRSGNSARKLGEERGRPGSHLGGSIPWEGLTRNKRSVWTITTKAFAGAHFATFPTDLVEPCILAGCPTSGKRCDCDEIISTPIGEGGGEDPTLATGRAGMNRPRGADEGTRPITRREQRWHATQLSMRDREQLKALAGEAFAHYVRTDRSGARPLPEPLRLELERRGWITEAPPCIHFEEGPGTVLDPFGGAGTVGLVADRLGRNAILIELNPEYVAMSEGRIRGDSPLFAEVSA